VPGQHHLVLWDPRRPYGCCVSREAGGAPELVPRTARETRSVIRLGSFERVVARLSSRHPVSTAGEPTMARAMGSHVTAVALPQAR